MEVAAAEPTVPPSPVPATRYALGLLGMLVGVLGLAAAIAGPHVAEAYRPPPPKLSDTLAEAGDKLAARLAARARGEPPPAAVAEPQPTPWGRYLTAAGAALGLAGALAGTAGWVRREDHRLAGGAIAVGFVAVAWVYIVAALVIALVIFFLLVLFSSLSG